jgi:hypothetical protein
LPDGCSSRSAQTAIRDVRISVSFHSLMVTMSQKSSVPQAAKSVSQALIRDTGELIKAVTTTEIQT